LDGLKKGETISRNNFYVRLSLLKPRDKLVEIASDSMLTGVWVFVSVSQCAWDTNGAEWGSEFTDNSTSRRHAQIWWL